MGTGQAAPLDLDAISGESATVDFKAAFDPKSKQDWCELIKDMMAMTNSGGGILIVGVADDGSFSDYDVQTLLNVDMADVTNQIYSYTDQHFAGFAISEQPRFGRSVASFRLLPLESDCLYRSRRLRRRACGGRARLSKGVLCTGVRITRRQTIWEGALNEASRQRLLVGRDR
jgi:hypothetical protein